MMPAVYGIETESVGDVVSGAMSKGLDGFADNWIDVTVPWQIPAAKAIFIA